MILRVGLTGGIASGKSTIARMFAARGCYTVDADRLVTDLYLPGKAGYEAILRTYGESVLDDHGAIDRTRLAAVAFTDEASIARLNALIHPIVMAEDARIAHELEETSERDEIYMIEATLLLEAGGLGRYHRLVIVDVPPEEQLSRAISRGMNPTDASRRMEHQMPREERLRYADYVIDNRGSLADAEREVTRVHNALLADLAALRD